MLFRQCDSCYIPANLMCTPVGHFLSALWAPLPWQCWISLKKFNMAESYFLVDMTMLPLQSWTALFSLPFKMLKRRSMEEVSNKSTKTHCKTIAGKNTWQAEGQQVTPVWVKAGLNHVSSEGALCSLTMCNIKLACWINERRNCSLLFSCCCNKNHGCLVRHRVITWVIIQL